MTVDDQSQDPVDALAEEFLDQLRQGQHPSIEEYCERLPEHAAQIRRLFPSLQMLEQFKDPAEADAPASHATLDVEKVGDYRILTEIGRGGMGVVYEAEQESLGRHVALKVLPLTLSQRGNSIHRFQREARAAARMHHTNIVPVFEVGQDGDQFYFAMQLIRGQSLDLVLDDLVKLRNRTGSPSHTESSLLIAQSMASGVFRPISFANRESSETSVAMPDCSSVATTNSDLVASEVGDQQFYRSVARVGFQTADALAYAHARSIIHRDIKPSNLILDAGGVVWLTDFGLAASDEENITKTGDIIGTLRYMPPERFQGTCDARSDIYSLGLTLYELLVLKPAFDSSDRLTLVRLIRETEPPTPRSIDPQIPLDLETIILKSIDKDPARRYESATEFTEDLRRFIDDEPVRARRLSTVESVSRWGRRNRALASMTALALLLFACLTLGSILAAMRFRNASLVNQELAESNGQLLIQKSQEAERANQAERKATRALDLANQRGEELTQLLYASHMNLAGQAARVPGNYSRIRQLTDRWLPAPGAPDLRGWEWYYLKSSGMHDMYTLKFTGQVYQLRFAPNSGLVAFGAGQDIRVLNPITQQIVHEFPKCGRAYCIDWSRDGRTLIAGTSEKRLIGIEVENGRRLFTIRTNDSVPFLEASPTADEVAVKVRLQPIEIRSTTTGEVLRTLVDSKAVTFPIWSPDGQSVVAIRSGGGLRFYDARTGNLMRELTSKDRFLRVAWSPDGRFIVAVGREHALHLFAADGRLIRSFGKVDDVLKGIAWHPESNLVATVNRKRRLLRVWNTTTGICERVLEGHADGVDHVAWSPSGGQILTGSVNGELKVWAGRRGAEDLTIKCGGEPICGISWSADGRWLAVKTEPRLHIFDSATGGRVLDLASGNRVNAIWHPNKNVIATPTQSYSLRLINIKTREETTLPTGHDEEIRAMDWSPSGDRIATTGHDCSVSIIDVESAEVTFRLDDEIQYSGLSVKWSPDGSVVASAHGHGHVRLWNSKTGRLINEIECHKHATTALCWSPDGRSFVTASNDRTVKQWNAESLELINTLTGHSAPVLSAAWHPDGNRIATASTDQSVKLWNTDTVEVLTIPAQSRLQAVIWDPSGHSLSFGGTDGVVHVLNANRAFEGDR